MLREAQIVAALVALAGVPARAAADEIPGVKVIGGSTCPSADEVAAELAGLVPTIPAGLPPDVAEVRPGLAGGLLVRLARASGRTVGERSLAEEGSCRDRARTAAVLIASWETSLPEAATDAPRLPRLVPRTPPAPPEPRPAIFVGFGGGAAIDAQGVSEAVAIEVARALGQTGFLRAGFSHDGRGAAKLGPGTISWWRAGVQAGGGAWLGQGPVAVELGAAALLTVLATEASGYPVQRSHTTLDPGLMGSARLVARGARAGVWVGVAAAWWAQRMVGTIEGLDGHVEVPDRQILLGLGLEIRVR